MSDLSALHCIPCRGGVPPLTQAEIASFSSQAPDWVVVEQDDIPRLRRSFKLKNFAQALAFTNRIGELAEAEDHHPAILTEWGRVTVTWWTHAIKGLHQNDYIMAAKTDQAYLILQSQTIP
jgi:4a-hydroxytetrahydrobiopterin dehydratase